MSTTKEHTLRYTYYDREDEMPAQELELVKKALAAREKAYAQYSGFMVGAAVLLENGIILTGNNQENAAYPSGLCAERVAVYHAGAEYPDVKMLKIAVCGGKKGSSSAVPVAPCGACRAGDTGILPETGKSDRNNICRHYACPGGKSIGYRRSSPVLFRKGFSINSTFSTLRELNTGHTRSFTG